MIQTAEHASQQGHWYDMDGRPAYTIIGKNGKERNTTLRDARANSLVPSVTSIIRCAAAPGLQAWKDEQMIMACLTMPRIEGEAETDYITRIKRDAGAQAEQARDRGTLIHAYIQEGFYSHSVLSEEGQRYYRSARELLDTECGFVEWASETSFAWGARYGGKVDIHTDGYVVDFKTTEKPMDSLKTWDEHALQLAAYDMGLNNGLTSQCGILYINVHTAESRILWIPSEEITRGWKCFKALLDYYYAKSGLGGNNGNGTC
jgi:hypothetical protein